MVVIRGGSILIHDSNVIFQFVGTNFRCLLNMFVANWNKYTVHQFPRSMTFIQKCIMVFPSNMHTFQSVIHDHHLGKLHVFTSDVHS